MVERLESRVGRSMLAPNLIVRGGWGGGKLLKIHPGEWTVPCARHLANAQNAAGGTKDTKEKTR